MGVRIDISEYLKRNNMTQKDLAVRLNITDANLSNLLSGKSYKGLWDNLEKMAALFNCSIGDMIVQTPTKKIIPMFLDYSGTTDNLLKGGVENLKKFLDAINALERKLTLEDPNHDEYEIRAYIITGTSTKKALPKVVPFHQMAKRYGMPTLFNSAVTEYCGFDVQFNDNIPVDEEIKTDPDDKECFNRYFTSNVLVKNLQVIEDSREEINEILRDYTDGEGTEAYIDSDVKSMFNVQFGKISEEAQKEAVSRISLLFQKKLGKELNGVIDVVPYYDEYGIECDFKPSANTKPNSVKLIMSRLREEYDVPFIIIGGDNKKEDIAMYTGNKEELTAAGIRSIFIAPSNIGELTPEYENDPNIIVSNFEKVSGVIDGIEKVAIGVRYNRREGEFEWEI